MGFVKENQFIESWLKDIEAPFQVLTDSEYRKASKGWQTRFAGQISENGYSAQGENAMLLLENMLPCGVYVFNLPGSKLLQASTSHHEPTFGYSVSNLHLVERELFNRFDAIVTDHDFDFTCLYTHEWQSMALPVFYHDENK